MKWKFEEEFRLDKPETIGETDTHFDLDNYKDWLEFQLSEARKQLSQLKVTSSVCHCRKNIESLNVEICNKCYPTDLA